MPAGDDSPGSDAAASPLERTEPLRMGARVLATDGECGELVPADHHVTHVLLQVGDEIRVGLTKQQVEELPPVDLR